VPTELTIDENCSQLARLLMKQDKNDNDAQVNRTTTKFNIIQLHIPPFPLLANL
jgi:hypothetical protein